VDSQATRWCERFPFYPQSTSALPILIISQDADLKNELSELLYPLLVHCYLELMSKQYTAEARDLLAHYRHEHEPEFFDEITTLANAGDASQLDTCPVASRYLHQAKTKVYLCHESDRLLTEFLHTKRLHIIVRLLNQYISVVIYGNTVHDMPPQMR
jgi:transcription initiation factor TFIID subunit 5